MLNSDTVAVFDVDRTLLDTNLFRLFLRFCVGSRRLPWLRVAGVIWALLMSLALRRKEGLRRAMYRCVRGMSRDEVAVAWAEQFLSVADAHILDSTRTALREHVRAGRHVVLLTNNLDFLVRPLQAAVGAHDAICLQTDVDESGCLVSPPPGLRLTIQKADAIRALACDRSWDLSESYGYGDSEEDHEFLGLVGYAFKVARDGTLRELRVDQPT